MKAPLVAAFVIALGAGLSLPGPAGLAGAEAQTLKLPERGQAADFTVTSLGGAKLNLADLRSRGPVILDFWATWCKPCLMELPELDRLQSKYRDRGLTVVGISVDGPRNFAKVRPFATKLRLRFPIAIDRDQGLQQVYQVKAYPTTFLIAPDGRIAWFRQGYLPGDGEVLGETVEALLDSAAVPSAP